MQLDAAFALQDSVVRTLAPPSPLHGPRAFALRALGRPARKRKPPPPSGIAVGVTPAEEADYKLAVRVQRRELLESRQVAWIVDAAGGEADVKYVGRISKRADPRDRARPLRMGLSVGLVDGTAGTLGCFVRGRGGAILMLSNNHVLANENRARANHPVIQPAPWDGGEEANDVVAHMCDFVPLEPEGINRVDCATATLVEGIGHDAATLIDGVGALDARPYEPRKGLLVEKIGRTTGRTVGRLSALNVNILGIEYDTGDNVRFDGQLEIEDLPGENRFSDEGDSGAIIFTKEDRRPIGLLFGGDDGGEPGQPGVTYANPIGEVMAALGVTLVP